MYKDPGKSRTRKNVIYRLTDLKNWLIDKNGSQFFYKDRGCRKLRKIVDRMEECCDSKWKFNNKEAQQRRSSFSFPLSRKSVREEECDKRMIYESISTAVEIKNQLATIAPPFSPVKINEKSYDGDVRLRGRNVINAWFVPVKMKN